MILSGAAANAAAIIAGGLLGSVFRKGIPEKVNMLPMQGWGLCVLYVGISGALKGENIIVVILSIVIGAVIGELLDFDKRLLRMATGFRRSMRAGASDSTFAEGFVTCTHLFLRGRNGYRGFLQAALRAYHQTLYAKALIDGISP
jgi:uncharacterized membrane protein YqgA involved in biofilm formation